MVYGASSSNHDGGWSKIFNIGEPTIYGLVYKHIILSHAEAAICKARQKEIKVLK